MQSLDDKERIRQLLSENKRLSEDREFLIKVIEKISKYNDKTSRELSEIKKEMERRSQQFDKSQMTIYDLGLGDENE